MTQPKISSPLPKNSLNLKGQLEPKGGGWRVPIHVALPSDNGIMTVPLLVAVPCTRLARQFIDELRPGLIIFVLGRQHDDPDIVCILESFTLSEPSLMYSRAEPVAEHREYQLVFLKLTPF
jgi:hypothetical protein